MQEINVETTPLISVVSARYTPEALDAAIAEALSQIEACDSVKSAKEKLDSAEAQIARLQASHAALNARAKLANDRLVGSRDGLARALASGGGIDDTALHEQGAAALERDGALSAIALVVEELLPGAQHELLVAKIANFDAQASEIKRFVNERAAALVEGLTSIADVELAVEIDITRCPVIDLMLEKRSRLVDLVARTRAELKFSADQRALTRKK